MPQPMPGLAKPRRGFPLARPDIAAGGRYETVSRAFLHVPKKVPPRQSGTQTHPEKERPKVDPRLPLEFISWRCRKLPGTPFKIVLEEAMKHQQMDGNRGKPERYGERGTYALRL